MSLKKCCIQGTSPAGVKFVSIVYELMSGLARKSTEIVPYVISLSVILILRLLLIPIYSYPILVTARKQIKRFKESTSSLLCT